MDVSRQSNDEKNHPNSYEVDTESDIGEFHPFDPHKAMKAIEVGDLYFKKQNYRAAISRYQEALNGKPNDAEATISWAKAQEKSGDKAAAAENYQRNPKILPHGPYAQKAQKRSAAPEREIRRRQRCEQANEGSGDGCRAGPRHARTIDTKAYRVMLRLSRTPTSMIENLARLTLP